MPEQRVSLVNRAVSLMNHAVSLMKHAVSLVKPAVSLVKHAVTDLDWGFFRPIIRTWPDTSIDDARRWTKATKVLGVHF